MAKAPANAGSEASSVKIEEGTETPATPNTIAKPKTVSTDNFGNQIEEA
jgi:hypothetical protein